MIGIVPPRVGGLAMMFSMGLSLGHQEKIMACSWTDLVIGQTLKFIIGPIAMCIASKIVGLHGDTLRIAIMQAAVPQAITSFIFAKEFGLHAEVVSTMVITGMLSGLAIPTSTLRYLTAYCAVEYIEIFR